MDKALFLMLFVDEMKRLYVGHTSEGDDGAKNNAEKYRQGGKNEGVFEPLQNKYLPVVPKELEHFF